MIKVTIGGVIAILQLDWGCACRRDPLTNKDQGHRSSDRKRSPEDLTD